MRAPFEHGEFLGLKRFPALDGLRAVAALMVVLFHSQGPDWLQGWLGVQVFFVLSGFLITTLLLREEGRKGRISLADFYRRRAFRILPVYFLVLLLTAVGLLVAGEFFRDPLGHDFPLYLVFFNEFGHGGPYGQSWSLGIEQKFYLLWPLLAFVVGRSRRLSVTLGLMAVALAVAPFTVSADPRGWPVHYFSVLVGCLLAITMHSPRGYRLIRPLTRPWVTVVAAVLFVGAHLSVTAVSNAIDKSWLLSTIPGFVSVVPLYAVAVALMLPALLVPGPPQWLLSRRPMVFLGERSYSIYLWQSIAQGVVIAILPASAGIGRWLPTAIVAVVLADLCYRWLERPMIRRGRQVTQRRRTALDATSGH
ncbi:acyltransferase family protein [Kutzneria sp. CA-103260]|uniref:acyltransferase family protein n=1 Tax=Kutzneria sp. CA-103260 TaxID=2802641 RepID=UPI001BEF44FF|nr:acyltransferase [Kutzneria sp. CA-103260]QUQ66267.1 acyltransferase [Kutzneria sp. CA-103260]